MYLWNVCYSCSSDQYPSKNRYLLFCSIKSTQNCSMPLPLFPFGKLRSWVKAHLFQQTSRPHPTLLQFHPIGNHLLSHCKYFTSYLLFYCLSSPWISNLKHFLFSSTQGLFNPLSLEKHRQCKRHGNWCNFVEEWSQCFGRWDLFRRFDRNWWQCKTWVVLSDKSQFDIFS